jgi:hypothetical protein
LGFVAKGAKYELIKLTTRVAQCVYDEMLANIWRENEYRLDVCCVNGAYMRIILKLFLKKQAGKVQTGSNVGEYRNQ